MKITSRTLIPVFVLVLLALGAVGVASASGLTVRAILFQEQEEVEIFGSVEQITPNFVTVEGQVISLTPQTEFKNDIVLGDIVKVHVVVGADGSLTAREIELSLPAAVDDNSNTNDNSNDDIDDDNSNINDNSNDDIDDDDDNSNMNENENDDIDDEDNSNMNDNSNDDIDDDDNNNMNDNSDDDSDDDSNNNSNDNSDDDSDDDDNSNDDHDDNDDGDHGGDDDDDNGNGSLDD